MRAYGDIEVTRSGLIAVSLETKKLRLSPPIPTRGEALRTKNTLTTE
jgi:acetolactate synthase-1/3 small subunit